MWIPVLAIEDDELVREALRRSLKLYGFRVHLAKDGPEGLKLAHEAKPAFILFGLDDAGNGWIGGAI